MPEPKMYIRHSMAAFADRITSKTNPHLVDSHFITSTQSNKHTDSNTVSSSRALQKSTNSSQIKPLTNPSANPLKFLMKNLRISGQKLFGVYVTKLNAAAALAIKSASANSQHSRTQEHSMYRWGRCQRTQTIFIIPSISSVGHHHFFAKFPRVEKPTDNHSRAEKNSFSFPRKKTTTSSQPTIHHQDRHPQARSSRGRNRNTNFSGGVEAPTRGMRTRREKLLCQICWVF